MSIQKEARADLAAPPVCHSGASSLSLQILHFFQIGFLSIHVSVFVWYISVTFLVAMSAYRLCFLIPVDCDVAHLSYLQHKQINIQPVQSLKISRYEKFSQMMPIMK